MRVLPILLFLIGIINSNAQDLPLGYISYFKSDFSNNSVPENLFFASGTEYKISSGVLSINDLQDSLDYFLPPSVTFINNNIFGEYIVETRVKYSEIASDSLGGVYFIVALRDTGNYYFVQLNDHGAGFYRIYKGELLMVDSDSSISLSNDKWLDIRIERDILHRTILIKYNGSSATFTDANLVMGYFGIGAKNANLQIDRLNIWAPTSIEQPIPLRR